MVKEWISRFNSWTRFAIQSGGRAGGADINTTLLITFPRLKAPLHLFTRAETELPWLLVRIARPFESLAENNCGLFTSIREYILKMHFIYRSVQHVKD